VVGMASSLPLDAGDPAGASNRRISILVMTREAEERLLGSNPLWDGSDAEAPRAAAGNPPKS